MQAGSGGGAGGVGGAADSNGSHDFTGALEGSHSAIFGGNGGAGGSFGGSGGGFGGSFGNAPMENGNAPAPAVVCSSSPSPCLESWSGDLGIQKKILCSFECCNSVASFLFILRTLEVDVSELYCCEQHARPSDSSYCATHSVQSSQICSFVKEQAFSVLFFPMLHVLAVGAFCISALTSASVLAITATC